MSGQFDKFGWLKALQSDPDLTDIAFRIGVVIGTTYTRADGTGWVIELDALADAARHIARNTVKAGVRQLANSGYIAETYRSQGGRGARARASFNLKPARPDMRVSGENPHVQTTKPARLDDKTRTSRRTKNRVDQPKDPPTGTSSGTSSGTAAPQPETSPAEPPPPKPKKYPRPKTDAKALADLLTDPRARSPKQRRPPEPERNGLSPRAQAAIDAARANLDRAERDGQPT